MTKNSRKQIAGLSNRQLSPRPAPKTLLESEPEAEFNDRLTDWDRTRATKMMMLAIEYGVDFGKPKEIFYELSCRLAAEFITGFQEEAPPRSRSKDAEDFALFCDVEYRVLYENMKVLPAARLVAKSDRYGKNIKASVVRSRYYRCRKKVAKPFQSLREWAGDEAYANMLKEAALIL
jgi:hypothetical protein